MISVMDFGSYNERRYSRPWCAKVYLQQFTIKYDFCGVYTGSVGLAGSVMVDATVGDVVAAGQKDYRGNSSIHKFFLVEENGLKEVTKDEALKILKQKKEVGKK